MCSCRGLNPSPKRAGTLLRSRSIRSAKTIARTARELNALAPFPPGVLHCPADFGSATLLLFAYRQRPTDRVLVDPSGCQRVANGHLLRRGAVRL